MLSFDIDLGWHLTNVGSQESEAASKGIMLLYEKLSNARNSLEGWKLSAKLRSLL